MVSLLQRATEQELMDDLNCNGEVVNQTLRELEIINRLLGGDYVTLDGIGQLLRDKDASNTYSIADLGCGGGDMLIKIARWSKKKNLKLTLTGVDANPHIVDFAVKNCSSFPEINFEARDVLSNGFLEKQFDIVIATLFVHHFTNEELIRLFTNLKRQARIGIVINDIHRHSFAYHSIRFLTKFFSKSAMVRFDAPLSVRRAFRKSDLKFILSEAGIVNYSLKWKWAFRWQLVIKC